MEIAKEYVINDPEDLLECPYEASHMIRAKRMSYHLVKCRLSHASSEMSRCPYNATHEVYTVELRYHMATCEDKQRVHGKIVQETLERENQTKGCVETPGYIPLNVWGESWEEDLPADSIFAKGRINIESRPQPRRAPAPMKQPAKPTVVTLTEEEKRGLTGRQLQKLHLRRKAELEQAAQENAERKRPPTEKLRAPHQLSQSLAVHEGRQLQDIYQQALPQQQHRAVALGRGRGLLTAGAVAAGRGVGGTPNPNPAISTATTQASGAGRGLLGRKVTNPPPGFSSTCGVGMPSGLGVPGGGMGMPNGGLGDAAMMMGGTAWQPGGPLGRGVGRGGGGDLPASAWQGYLAAGRGGGGGVGATGALPLTANGHEGGAWSPAGSTGGKMGGLNPQGKEMESLQYGEPGDVGRVPELHAAASFLHQQTMGQSAGYPTSLSGHHSDSGTDDELAEKLQDLDWVGGGYGGQVPSPSFSTSASSLVSNPPPLGSWADVVDETYPQYQSGTSSSSSQSVASDGDVKNCMSVDEATKQLKKIIKKLRQIDQLDARVKAGFVLDQDSETKRQSRPLVQQQADQLQQKLNLQC